MARLAILITLAALASNAGAWKDQEHFYEYCKEEITDRKEGSSYRASDTHNSYASCIAMLVDQVLGLRKYGAKPKELDACKRAHTEYCEKEYWDKKSPGRDAR